MNSIALPDEGLPSVGEDSGNRGLWLGLGGIGLVGLLLFAALEANRQSNTTPTIAPPKDYAAATARQPGLVIPPAYQLGPYSMGEPPGASQANADQRSEIPPARLPPVRLAPTQQPENRPAVPASYAPVAPPPVALPVAPDPGRAAPTIVYDVAAGPASAPAGAGGEVAGSIARPSPAIASAAVDRSNLVSQGTLIYAVLETALDSTQSGQSRALVSNNVYNASGTKILIPKGSRVFGEYKADISSGQNRAQIVWGRLVRPDGVTIYLDSPASYPLGRAGVKGKVDAHFGERLLGALLQSTIDFGAIAASRAATSNSGVVVALPNAAQNAGSQIVQPPPKPTLRVRHGTRIAVFVSRDLDFSAVQ
jgi:type IV secretion system protein VirB10